MKFIMVGSGAVGSYFGAKLQQLGHEVVFIARGKQLQALRKNGLTLQHDSESITLTVTATDDLSAAGSADYVFITVKTWHVPEIIPQLTHFSDSHTRFLTLQNGVESAPMVADAVGEERTFAGLVRGFFQLDAPGLVNHVGVQPTIIFGTLDGERTPQAVTLFDILAQTGIHAELSDDIEAALWEKFLLVTALSGVGAVTRASIGEIRDYEPTYEMLKETMLEILHLGQGRGVNLNDGIPEKLMQFVSTFPYEATTSMQRDIMNGLPSELEAQTGAVVRLGREIAIPTPLNQMIYNSLILQERRARHS
ncbi:MAG: 2-dehydropantoate 2-reductase [Anaerolineae bacterium]|nr:2-dehydropantoate 2-reductase [Anaerolineae bacterium]